MDEESNCGNCRFWSDAGVIAGVSCGSCRVNPPVIVNANDHKLESVAIATMFPVTMSIDWCGEFRHKNRMP